MLRSEKVTKIFPRLESVNNLIDRVKLPDQYVPWAHGGYFNGQSAFARLPGKLMCSTTTTFGRVYALKQLEFQTRSVVLLHSSNVYSVADSLNLSSSNTSTIPFNPFIL